MREELENARKQQRTQQENSGAEQARLEGQIKELQAANAAMEQEVKRLTETLAEEAKRRETAELRAGDIGKERTKLDGELARIKQAQAELRRELEKTQEERRMQQESSGAGQTRLEDRQLSLLQLADLTWILVDARHDVPEVRKACARHQPDIPGTDHRYSHEPTYDLQPRLRRSRSSRTVTLSASTMSATSVSKLVL